MLSEKSIPLAAARKPGVRRYLEYKLGREGGRKAWFNFFIKPFGAASFAQFWRLWNPLYGYFLYYYAYRPLFPQTASQRRGPGDLPALRLPPA